MINLRLCDNPACCTRSENLSPETLALVDRTVQALLHREGATPGFVSEVFRRLLQQHPSTTLAPKSGRYTSWVPGIIKPPYVPKELLQPRDYWYCSDACFDVHEPERAEHERLVHDRYDEKPHVRAVDPETLRKAELRLATVERLAPRLSVPQKEAIALRLMDEPDTNISVALFG